MAEYKNIGNISVVIDSDNGYDKIGDVAGGFDEQLLKKHIQNFGHEGLLKAISYLNFQVISTIRELNSEKQNLISNDSH